MGKQTKLDRKTLRIIKEYMKEAKIKHPDYPTDVVHMMSIVNEEAGEATQAANNYYYHNAPISKVKSEIYQTMVVCLRTLEGLDE